MSTSYTESVYKVDILTVLLTLCELISESVNVTLWGFHTARVSRVWHLISHMLWLHKSCIIKLSWKFFGVIVSNREVIVYYWQMQPPITITITGIISPDYYYYYYYYYWILWSLLLLLLLLRHKCFITITITITISNSLTTLV